MTICRECSKEFVPGEEGDDDICDNCQDIIIREGAWGHPFQPVEVPHETDQ